MDQIVWTLLLIYSFLVVYIFFICMNIADYFDLKDISLPNNKVSKTIRKHVTLVLMMLFISSGFLYYYNHIEPTSGSKILVLLGFVVYCYIPYRFALDLIPLKDQAIIRGSDLEKHDQKQTSLHIKTHGLVEVHQTEIKLENELLIKKLTNSGLSKKEGYNILDIIIANTEKINASIDSEINLLTQKIIQLQKDVQTLNNLTSNTNIDLNSSLSNIKSYINNNPINDKDYIQKLNALLENDASQCSSMKELSVILNRIVILLTTKNKYLIEENKISKIFRTKSEALKFIEANQQMFDYDIENFIAFLTADLTSNAGIRYLKQNSRKNGLDKTYFLNTLLPQMFNINFAKINLDELQDFISSNFIEEKKDYISINKSQVTQTSFVISSKTLIKFIRDNKSI